MCHNHKCFGSMRHPCGSLRLPSKFRTVGQKNCNTEVLWTCNTVSIILAVLDTKIQIKPMVIFKGLNIVPCDEIDFPASSEPESNESADESEKRKSTANWSTLEYLFHTT